MIRIVIVDDEVLVRQGIKSYIESSDEDMEVSGIFSNAKDAIDFLNNNSIQILITDIEMAQMDGVELIRYCVNHLYPMGIIVLSCHDNFEYARDVFALGADAYILKHEVNQEELISKIKQAGVRLKNILQEPYYDNPTYKKSTAENSEKWTSNSFAFAKICFKAKFEQFELVRTNAAHKVIYYVVTEVASSNSLGQVIRQGEDLYLRIAVDNKDDIIEADHKIEMAQKHLCTNILNYFNERIYLAVSDIHNSQSDFQIAVDQANRAADAAFYNSKASILFFNHWIIRMQDQHTSFHTKKIDLINIQWRKDLKNDINKYISYARKTGLSPKKFKQNMQGFIYKLEDHLFRYYNTSIEKILPQAKLENDSLFDDFDTCNIVRDYVMYLIGIIIEYIAGMKNSDAVFSRIIEYIDSNYASSVTLTKLSEIFHINQSHLCKLFRNNMQTGFVSYLNKVRINHAKRLLISSNLSIDEISEAVGFNSANYFVRVFKKTTGKTTGEYRNKSNFEQN